MSGLKQEPLNDLLFSVTTLSSERVIEERPDDLAPYGLAKPSVTVRVTLASGEVRELYLGDLTPAGDSYYLAVKGDPRVFTVREHHGTFFRYGLQDLWEGARTPVDAGDVARLRVAKNGKTVLEILKRPDLFRSDLELRTTTLSVVYPWAAFPKPADLYTLTEFARSLASLQPEKAVDADVADLSRYGLDRPSAELLLTDGAGTSLHLWTGKVDAGVLYLRFEKDPTVYAGDPALLEMLDVDPFRFANRFAMIVRLDRIDRLAISAGAVRRVLDIRRASPGTEEGAAWLVDGRAVDVKAFKDFYTGAMSLQADTFHGDPVTGEPEVTFQFTFSAGPVRTYTVGFVPYSQEFYAVVKNGASDMLVNRQQVKVLLQGLEELAAQAGAG